MCLAIPGKIIQRDDDRPRLAVVDVAGVRRRVDLGLLADDPPGPGDWVLIHVGFAMSRISEADAQEQMRVLALLGEEAAALEEVRGYGNPAPAEAGSASAPADPGDRPPPGGGQP